MIVKLLTEQPLEFLSLKGGCTGSSESTLVKMPHCWKFHALAQIYYYYNNDNIYSNISNTSYLPTRPRQTVQTQIRLLFAF